MDLQAKLDELNGTYEKVKDLYKEASWFRRNMPLLAKHDEKFNKKTVRLEKEINREISALEKELNIHESRKEPIPYLTIALKTEDYRDRFNVGFNLKNAARKFCYGVSGVFGGGTMILRDMASTTASPSFGSTAFGVLCGFGLSFFMEFYTCVTHQWEEKSSFKQRIKDIKKAVDNKT